jgi:hypothetical protein
MMVLMIGVKSGYLKETLERNYLFDQFDLVEEIYSITKESEGIVINENILLSHYNAIILGNTTSAVNYLYHELDDIPWYPCNPFDLRSSTNHNNFFTIGKYLKLSIPPAKPIFNEGKVSVIREFPAGRELSFLIFYNEVISLSNYDMGRRLVRTCQTFLKMTRSKMGVLTFIEDKEGELYLKDFNPLIDWGSLKESTIKSIMDRILFSAKVVANSKRSKM